jgi:hypothetical protein
LFLSASILFANRQHNRPVAGSGKPSRLFMIHNDFRRQSKEMDDFLKERIAEKILF